MFASENKFRSNSFPRKNDYKTKCDELIENNILKKSNVEIFHTETVKLTKKFQKSSVKPLSVCYFFLF